MQILRTMCFGQIFGSKVTNGKCVVETLGIVNGKRNFRSPGEPKIDTDTKIAVFHGHPNIHECNDKWPGDNWY
jgi:hypothetical protein